MPDLKAQLVLAGLRLLVELGNLLVGCIAFLLLLLGVFDVFQEQLVSLIVDLLSRALRLAVNILFERANPVDFL